ncbi:MAG: response regulator [Jatrophihabitans sp.]|uniref:response regulator n=1 Tax=Jatrophihabitans sp. TaxID=1932789 RepID=UPI003F7F57DE
MPIRVVVADDDPGVRSALRAVLDEDSRFHVVGEAGSGAEVGVVAALEQPDVVLLDVRMPGGGIEAARAIAESQPRTTLVAVTASADAQVVAAMLAAGANGVLAKGRLNNLGDLVERCHGGEIVLATPSAAAGLRIFADNHRAAELRN